MKIKHMQCTIRLIIQLSLSEVYISSCPVFPQKGEGRKTGGGVSPIPKPLLQNNTL